MNGARHMQMTAFVFLGATALRAREKQEERSIGRLRQLPHINNLETMVTVTVTVKSNSFQTESWTAGQIKCI